MRIKRLLLILTMVAPLVVGSAAYAVMVPSDFAQDVKDGTAQLQNDTKAQAQADNLKADEKVEGQVDDGQVDVNETVGDQEGNMDNAQSGESHDSTDKVDAGGSADAGAVSTPANNGGNN
ncbi:MAG: hypothetical protein NVS1B7_0250 [Candidatus Saccharimonadales bacterium]